jgi:hypothetical protein
VFGLVRIVPEKSGEGTRIRPRLVGSRPLSPLLLGLVGLWNWRPLIVLPIRDRLFNLAAAVSLVLCVATLALWVRGRVAWRDDIVTYQSKFRADGETWLSAANTPFGIRVGR